MSSPFSLCLCIYDRSLARSLSPYLSGERYCLEAVDSPTELLDFVLHQREKLDCLIIQYNSAVFPLFNQLYEQGTLLPLIIVEPALSSDNFSSTNLETPTYFYHSAEVRHQQIGLAEIPGAIERAIAQFLHLAPSCSLIDQPVTATEMIVTENQPNFLLLQQRRLAEKLKERLGYLGVYYKRNPNHFYRNLSQQEKQELIKQLSADYREIMLNYFVKGADINQGIDQLVNRAFFSDLAVSQILEIHMELINEFSQQLKLEGRSEEILLDYRLTLIDILAHLGEMYRRSIPREDIPFELLYQID